MGKVKTKILHQEPKFNFLDYITIKPLMNVCCSITSFVQPFYAEEVQIHNASNVLESGEPGPYLWLPKHETVYDHLFIIPLWKYTPSKPRIKIAKRTAPHWMEHFLDKTLLRPFVFQVRRTTKGEGHNLEAKVAMHEENQEKLSQLEHGYRDGVHALMFPEGTTNSDGTVFPIRAGCYQASKVDSQEIVETVAIIPIGLTVDFLAGDKHWLTRKDRYVVFVHPGKPFFYDPIEGLTYEAPLSEIRRDRANHTRKIKKAFLDLNVITPSQLIGEYFLQKVKKSVTSVSREELYSLVSDRAEAFKQLGVAIDHALLEKSGLQERVDNVYSSLLHQGYVHENNINKEKVLHNPKKEVYKKENPLRFCANRLLHVAEDRQDIQDVLKTIN